MSKQKVSGSNRELTSSEKILLDDKKKWLDVKDKADKLAIAYEQKYMQVISQVIELINILLEVGLESIEKP